MRKKLLEKKNDLITRAEEVLKTAKTEVRELTEAEAEELAEIRDNVRRIVATLKLDDDFREMGAMEVKEDNAPEAERAMETRAIKIGDETIEVREDEIKAFDAFIRNAERADMTITDNGAIIPTTISDWVIRKVYDICPILDRSQKFNVKGNLDIPYYPADSKVITVAYQQEFVALTGSAGKFSTISLTGFLAGCLTKISRSLVNNTRIDVVGFVVDEMAYAIKRFIEKELLVGTNGKVTGLSTLNNSVTAGSATAITGDDLIKLHDKVKDEFQDGAIWIMSPATRTAIRSLKDGMNRYLLQDDISLPFGQSLLGKPVYVSDNMPEIASKAVPVYYGNMSGLATKFSEDINIEVLRERFADEHALGVVGWFEFDGKVADEQRISKLIMA